MVDLYNGFEMAAVADVVSNSFHFLRVLAEIYCIPLLSFAVITSKAKG